MKNKRIENKDLINAVKCMPCAACLKQGPSDAHHIKTKKSGGNDVQSNLVSLDRKCHSELHQLGLIAFCEKYPLFKQLLIKKGWYYCEVSAKWRHNEI